MKLFADAGLRAGRRSTRSPRPPNVSRATVFTLLPDQGGDRPRRRRRRDRGLRHPPARAPGGRDDDRHGARLARGARRAGSRPSSSSSSGSRARCRPSAPAGCSSTGTPSAPSPSSLEAELGPGQELAARLAAAALVAGLRVAEETAAARMEQEDRELRRPRSPRCSTAPWPSPRPASPRDQLSLGISTNAIAFPSGSGMFTCRSPSEYGLDRLVLEAAALEQRGQAGDPERDPSAAGVRRVRLDEQRRVLVDVPQDLVADAEVGRADRTAAYTSRDRAPSRSETGTPAKR